MVFDLAAAGALFGGLGQAAGGVAGLFDKGSGSRDQWEMFNQNVQNQDRYWMQNANLQREFAQNSIQWRANDAKAAGLHPIFAMGGNMAGATPTAYIPGDIGRSSSGGSDIGAALSNMGQGIERATRAGQTRGERLVSDLEKANTEAALAQADASRANAEFARMRTAAEGAKLTGQLGPPIPSLTGTDQKPINEAQPIATTTGGYSTHPSEKSKAEDEFGAPLMAEFLYRNRLLGMFGGPPAPEVVAAIKKKYPGSTGAYWDYLTFDWQPTYHKSGEGMVRRYTKGRREFEVPTLNRDSYGPPQYNRTR